MNYRIHKGKISDCHLKISENMRFTEFKLNDLSFSYLGVYVFEDGDEVVVYSKTSEKKKVNLVDGCKNLTKNFSIEVKNSYGGIFSAIFCGLFVALLIACPIWYFRADIAYKDIFSLENVTFLQLYGISAVLLCFLFVVNNILARIKLSDINLEIQNYKA